jgi:hypothetical protein
MIREGDPGGRDHFTRRRGRPWPRHPNPPLPLCCHPSRSPTSQMALTPRPVGGLATVEIARALLTSQASMTRGIRCVAEAA